MKKNFVYLFSAAAAGLFCVAPGQAKAVTLDNNVYAVVQQSMVVKGQVIDANGEPIVGASVVEKGTGNGTITDNDGNFTLKVKAGSTLAVSYVGYVRQELKAQPNVTVMMQESAENLGEVVVLGYGAQSRKQDLSASVGVISNAEELAARPVTSAESMLQGQLAGVTVQAVDGDPTSTPSLVIRGQGSKNGDNVLWVVDGVPGAPIPSMYDIESIVVLKDAASAAIYGATSGAGGCVLVTTKRAQKTTGAQLTYEGTVGVRQATNLIHGLTAQDQITMRQQSYANAGMTLPSGWSGNSGNAAFDQYIKTQRTDWTDEIFRSAFYQRHNVGLNYGNEFAQNRVSFAYDNDQGVLINTYNKNYNLHYTGNFNIFKWLSVSEDFNWKNNSSRTVDNTSAYSGAILSAIYMPQSAAVYDEDGTYGGTVAPEYADQFSSIHGDAINPVRMLTAANIFDRNTRTYSTTSVTFHDIVPGLKFVSRFSYWLNNSYYKSFSPIRDEVGKPNLKNTLYESSMRSTEWKTENTLTYDKTFGDHTIGALVSTTANKYCGRSFQVEANGFEDESENLQYLANAGTLYSYGDAMSGPDANVAIIARLAYSYADRYFLTASWRRDYASRLPKDNNYGDFPALTAAWKISNEKFFEPLRESINLLKLRASWGRVGNLGSIDYNYKANNLSTSVWNEQALYGAATGSMYGTFIYPSTALNSNLTWETSEQWDLGLDLALCRNRFNLSLDYFNKRTYNLIQETTTGWPNTIGVSAMLVNQGEIKNQGVELELGWHDRVANDWSYYVKGNFAWLKNEVTSTGIVQDDGTDGVWSGGGDWRSLPWCYQTCVGGALNQFYLVKTNGIIKTEADLAEAKKAQPNAVLGDLWFVDVNGDNTIDEKDRQYCGAATPKATFALSGGFSYKNLSVDVMLQGVAGAQVYYPGKCMLLSDVEGGFNRSSEILNAWSTSNSNSDIPRLSKTDPNGNWSTASDYFLEDGSYLRLKNVTVSYDFTSAIQKRAISNYISYASIYASGENLFTLTPYSGMDPECGGYDTMKYPVSRVLSLGVKIGFGGHAAAPAPVAIPKIVEKVVEKVVEKPVEKIVEKEVIKEVVKDGGLVQNTYVVTFPVNSSEIQNPAELAGIEKGSTVEVVAYASPEGNPDANQVLSQKRADAVANYLKAKGVNVVRTNAKGADSEHANRIAIITVK